MPQLNVSSLSEMRSKPPEPKCRSSGLFQDTDPSGKTVPEPTLLPPRTPDATGDVRSKLTLIDCGTRSSELTADSSVQILNREKVVESPTSRSKLPPPDLGSALITRPASEKALPLRLKLPEKDAAIAPTADAANTVAATNPAASLLTLLCIPTTPLKYAVKYVKAAYPSRAG